MNQQKIFHAVIKKLGYECDENLEFTHTHTHTHDKFHHNYTQLMEYNEKGTQNCSQET
jgi:hypothetical protein